MVTKPCSPNFQKTSTKGLEREYLNERDAVLRNSTTMDKFKAALMKKVNGGGTATSFNAAEAGDKAGAQNPSSTKSMTHLMSRRREELEDKRKQNEVKEKEDQDRFDKQNRVSILQYCKSFHLLLDEKHCAGCFARQNQG